MNRRAVILGGLSALLARRRAHAFLSQAPGIIPIYNPALTEVEVQITYGQSWPALSFQGTQCLPGCDGYSFANPYAFNPLTQRLLTPNVTNSVSQASGPMRSGAGVSIGGDIDGITGYTLDDPYTIGRCAVAAQQQARIRAAAGGRPIEEFCAAYGGSSWSDGGGGGLGPHPATFTGSVVADLLTVETDPNSPIIDGQGLYTDLVTAQTQVLFTGTGTGGTGTYGLTRSWTIPSGTTMTTDSVSWTNQATIIAAIQSLLPIRNITSPLFKSVMYIQGGAIPDTVIQKIADLTDMLQLYDAMDLPGAGTTGMQYYLTQPAPFSFATSIPSFSLSESGTVQFCRDNAPGAGGPWSGRCWDFGVNYPWPNDDSSNHTGPYGAARWGEKKGWVADQVERLGVQWTPLWRSTTRPITIDGNAVVIPFAKPSASDFANVIPHFQSDPNDGIKVWPGYGFALYRSSSPLTLSSVVVGEIRANDFDIRCTPTVAPNIGDEASYAWYGPGGPNPGPCAGVGGNLCMNGPQGLLFPNNTIDEWGRPFAETIAA